MQVTELEGLVEFSPPGQPQRWHRCTTNEILYANYQLRTGAKSRALLRLQDLTEVPLGPNSLIHILPPHAKEEGTGLSLLRGILYWFRRDDPRDHRIDTPTVSCASRGTEFSLAVREDGSTLVILFDGELTLRNRQGELVLQNRQTAEIIAGRPPVRRAFLEANQALQWRFYYPGILDLRELNLDPATMQALQDSLEAYGQGDLQTAIALYPSDRIPVSPDETLFLAALHLVVGNVEEAEAFLASLQKADNSPASEGQEANRRLALARALQTLIASVKLEPLETHHPRLPRNAGQSTDQEESFAQGLATVWMAESYVWQSKGKLDEALQAAMRAADISPHFGLAWSRIAELEFSLSRTREAKVHVARALHLMSRQAQALTLQGFILSGENKIGAAIDSFNQAMALDGALANAWLGRGLCFIRVGRLEEGLRDVQTASSLEPQRALLRSYLGKAFMETSRPHLAHLELERAKEIDANDPTPWLYSALLNQQQNQVNQAIQHLETSKQLNDQRFLYRSRFLLDQDQAVRGANLAGLYQDAGMEVVARQEAGRALNYDYVNHSAHLFLANSYNRQRDPNQVNLRFESAWLSEYLIANLLAPVHAGALSPLVTQNEYSHLFARDRLGLSSATEYRSEGDWTQATSQHGQIDSLGYALDATYRSFHGDRSNNDLEDLTLTLRLKHEWSARDSVYWQTTYYDGESGDVRQYYDPDEAQQSLRLRENQEPIVLMGYHRAWTPNSHTLLLAGWLHDRLRVDHPDFPFLAFGRDSAGNFLTVFQPSSAPLDYKSQFEALTLEGQHLWRVRRHTMIAGGRAQSGAFTTESVMDAGVAQSGVGPLASDPVRQDHRSDFRRFSLYAYDNFQWLEWFHLNAGLVYDDLEYPANYRFSPIDSGERTKDQLSPKAGFVVTPFEETAVRGSYTRSLGGVSIDQSVRLEPTQVAGFNQTYRSLIPESVVGALSASEFETFGLALDQNFDSGTYVSVQGEWLHSKDDQEIGMIDFISLPGVPNFPSANRARLDFDERVLSVTVNQLLGDMGATGARYRLSDVDLDQRISGTQGQLDNRVDATLHQVWLYALINHDCGLFAQADAVWSQQSNRGYTPDIPGDDFWQFNVHGGFRFRQRRLELRVSVLNLTDQDYRLNPLNLTSDLPRKRTLVTSLRFSF